MKPLFIQAPSKLKNKDWGFTPNKLYYIEEISTDSDPIHGKVIKVRNDLGNLVYVYEKKSSFIDEQDFDVIDLSHVLIPIGFVVSVISVFYLLIKQVS